MMKGYKLLMSLFIVFMAILFSSCSQHSCIGTWDGRGQGTQVVQLCISKDGTFQLRILPKTPDTFIQLYQGRETDYVGEWKSQSDDEVMLVCKKKIERYSDLSEDDSESNDVFYLRKDGAFCKYSPDYQSPMYDLIKQEQK